MGLVSNRSKWVLFEKKIKIVPLRLYLIFWFSPATKVTILGLTSQNFPAETKQNMFLFNITADNMISVAVWHHSESKNIV